MQAVILVGGEGTRLRPLTYVTPKPMVPIFGVPFLERTLARLKAAGIDEAILAAGYLPRQIIDHFGDGEKLGMKLTYVIEEQPLGTAGALKNVERHINGPFFVLNGDVLTSLDLRAMAESHRRSGAMASVHLIRVDDPSSFGCVVHDDTGRVSAFIEKPPRGTEPTNEVNAGTYLLDPEVLQLIPGGRKVSIERETFPRLIESGRGFYAFTTEDYWLDIGRPEQYLRAHNDVLEGRLQLTPLAHQGGHPGVFYGASEQRPGILGPSFVGPESSLAEGSLVGPLAVLGEGCKVATSAAVRESVLWDDVIIGEGASVRGSILASRVKVGARAVIEPGSVIGHDVEIAPDTLVEAGSRVGGAEFAPT